MFLLGVSFIHTWCSLYIRYSCAVIQVKAQLPVWMDQSKPCWLCNNNNDMHVLGGILDHYALISAPLSALLVLSNVFVSETLFWKLVLFSILG